MLRFSLLLILLEAIEFSCKAACEYFAILTVTGSQKKRNNEGQIQYWLKSMLLKQK